MKLTTTYMKYVTTRCVLLLLLCTIYQVSFAQSDLNIRGNIKDAQDNTPLVGVSVKEKGTSNGAMADANGNFSIKVSKADATLVITYIGYNQLEVPLNGRRDVNVLLTSESKGLNEVVVVGYGTQKKGDVTSAIASVKAEDFTKGAVRDAASLIQGKVAGLQVSTPSGDPTAGTVIQLRGLSTILSTTSPLVLVDGIPGDLNTVAPEDIESIDVLKDGSAAAIYGTRGTNGVIIITTRKPHGDLRSSVQYNGYTSVQTIARKPDFLTADDYRRLIKEGYGFTDYGTTTDWFKEVTRTPISQNHNLSVQGGSATSNYTASINYRGWQGLFLNSDNRQVTARADINHSMLDNKLKFNLNAISRTRSYWTGGDGASFNDYVYRQTVIRNPTDSVRNAQGAWKEQNVYFYDNPVAYLNESNGENNEREMRLNGTVTATPIKDLNIKLLVSGVKWSVQRGYAETKQHVSTVKNGKNGYASLGEGNRKDNLIELTTDYTKTLGDHRFTALAGYSYQFVKSEDFYMQNWDFPTDVYSWNNMGSGNALGRGQAAMHSEATSSTLIGGFARLNYAFKDKYLVMASIRREGSSKFGANHKWGTFPGVSLGWRIDQEDFMKNMTAFNQLKLRAGFGVTGITPQDSYRSLSGLGYGDRYLDNGVWQQSLGPSRNANPDLRWEKKQEYNVGLDFTMFDSRLSGSIDGYTRVTKDMLYNYEVPVPPYSFNSIMANVGEMKNQGIEILLNYAAVKSTDFTWKTGITYSTNKNRLVSLSNDLFQTTSNFFDPQPGYTGEPIQEPTHRVFIGGPIGDFYGYKSVDIDTDGKWIIEGADGQRKPIADAVQEDKKILGNGIPKHIGSWNNSFSYKNWDLNVSMRGAFGFQILNFQRMFYENPKNVQYNMLKSAFDPVYGKTILNNDLAYVSYYLENGNYVKIDNITLGYTIPIKNTKYIKNARIYASGLNTFTITGYKGIDPEVNTNGLAPGNDERDKYPTTRTFTFGINVTL
jgi:TonB-linked SusC/RagA family outer membrane protein